MFQLLHMRLVMMPKPVKNISDSDVPGVVEQLQFPLVVGKWCVEFAARSLVQKRSEPRLNDTLSEREREREKHHCLSSTRIAYISWGLVPSALWTENALHRGIFFLHRITRLLYGYIQYKFTWRRIYFGRTTPANKRKMAVTTCTRFTDDFQLYEELGK